MIGSRLDAGRTSPFEFYQWWLNTTDDDIGRFLRLYTTTIPAENRMVTLMHDPQYREAVAWQNVGYNQPPHPSFFIGAGMAEPDRANIATTGQSAAP
mgnify:CR=1 FL=1